jgi:hypothetical protein
MRILASLLLALALGFAPLLGFAAAAAGERSAQPAVQHCADMAGMKAPADHGNPAKAPDRGCLPHCTIGCAAPVAPTVLPDSDTFAWTPAFGLPVADQARRSALLEIADPPPRGPLL